MTWTYYNLDIGCVSFVNTIHVHYLCYILGPATVDNIVKDLKKKVKAIEEKCSSRIQENKVMPMSSAAILTAAEMKSCKKLILMSSAAILTAAEMTSRHQYNAKPMLNL